MINDKSNYWITDSGIIYYDEEPARSTVKTVFTKLYYIMLFPTLNVFVFSLANVMQLIHNKIYPEVPNTNQKLSDINLDYSKCFTTQDFQTVKGILSGVTQVNKELSNGDTAIINAASNCLIYYSGQNLVKALLNKGADINCVSVNGKSLLMIALDNYSLTTARMLESEAINDQHINWNYVNPNNKLSNADYVSCAIHNELSQANISLGKLEALLSIGLSADLINIEKKPLLAYLIEKQSSSNIIELVLKYMSDEYIKGLCNAQNKDYLIDSIDCSVYEDINQTLVTPSGHQEL